MTNIVEMMPVILFVIFILAGAYMIRKIGDSERERGKSEARYAHMADVNRERTDDINALNAKLLRKDEQIERLEEEVGLKNLMVLYLSKTLESICDVPCSPHPLPDCVRAKRWQEDAEKWAKKKIRERKKYAQES